MKTRTLDSDQQAHCLEYLQRKLGHVGYVSQVLGKGPSSVLLDIWNPSRPARVVQVAAVLEPGGTVSYRWSSSIGVDCEKYGGIITLVSRLGALLGEPDVRRFA